MTLITVEPVHSLVGAVLGKAGWRTFTARCGAQAYEQEHPSGFTAWASLVTCTSCKNPPERTP